MSQQQGFDHEYNLTQSQRQLKNLYGKSIYYSYKLFKLKPISAPILSYLMTLKNTLRKEMVSPAFAVVKTIAVC